MVGRLACPQLPASTRHRVALPEHGTGAVIHLHDTPPLVQVDDADPGIVEQAGLGHVQRLGADHRLPDPDKLPDVGQKPLEQLDLWSRPAPRADGVAAGPGEGAASRPVQPHHHALLRAQPTQPLVIGARGFQLLSGVQVGGEDHLAVGQLPEPWQAFVDRVVHVEPLAFQVFAALPPTAEPDEVGPDIGRRAFADQQGVPHRTAGFIDQGRGGRPLGIVEHGVV